MFFPILITWFLLFNQQIINPTAGYSVEYYEEVANEEPLVATESSVLYLDTTLDENINHIENNIENASFVKNSTEIHLEAETPESADDDVIELDVGGQKITTVRSTLTAVPNSKLALMFAKDSQYKSQPKIDKQGAVFFDYNPIHFNYLLDQLRTIKRMPKQPAYEIYIQAPNADIPSNFSYMISDLGLNPDRFLSPLVGVHLNLNIKSLVGWQECYRSRYDTPFDLLISLRACRSTRLLVACRSVDKSGRLILAGVSKWENIINQCPLTTHCSMEITNGAGFYYVPNQAWGFVGQPKDSTDTDNGYNDNHQGATQNLFYLTPCDSSDVNSQYRLCWSLRSAVNRGGGDRCGSVKNLHNATGWERVIYRAV